MNHIYQLIWNESIGAFRVASELARARGKRSRRMGCACSVCGLALTAVAVITHAQTLPVGGEIAAGQGAIQQAGNVLTVTQSSQNLVINWRQFDIGANEVVRFSQPNSSAIALNRVFGSDPSQILGSLDANGQVWLLNPNGVLFGKNAQVNVGGLVASTLNLSDEDFLKGQRTFSGQGAGHIVNYGSLAARDGGYVALLGGRVSNQGVVTARLGTVALASGERVTLDFAGDALLNVSVDQGALGALVDNQELIRADGGQVIMTARASNAVLETVVNNAGIVEARTVEREGGVIKLLGGFEGGTVNVAGTLDASAPNGGDGGFIDTSGFKVAIAEDVRITTDAVAGRTGTWLIDPNDYTIAATGGDITGAGISALLADNNIVIRSVDGANADGNGDIFVNDAVTWDADTTLTLEAVRNIEISNALTNTGSGNLVLRADKDGTGVGTVTFLSGGSVSMAAGRTDLYYNPTAYTSPTNYSVNVTGEHTAWMLVNNIDQLDLIRTNLAGHYALGRDIDASVTREWDSGKGFMPMGYIFSKFTGSLDGLNHTIDGLYINRGSTSNVGLFTSIGSTGVVRNLGLTNVEVNGASRVGALAGDSEGTISGSYSTGVIKGTIDAVGGLVGRVFNGGAVVRSYSTADVTSDGWYVGGLLGALSNGSSVTQSHATGAVRGAGRVGGLIGDAHDGVAITQSYATGRVSGDQQDFGGLVGYLRNESSITESYASGAVDGESPYGNYAGGLVGTLENGSTIERSYATGAVSGNQAIGGLAGRLANGSTIEQSYATGAVSGYGYIGGLVGRVTYSSSSGYGHSSVTESYAANTVEGQSYVGGLFGAFDTSTKNVSQSFWDIGVSGQTIADGKFGALDGATGLTTSQMMQASAFAGWNIADHGGSNAVWRIYEGETRPLLRSFLAPLKITIDARKTYDGEIWTGGKADVTATGFRPGDDFNSLLGELRFDGDAVGARNAGSYSASVSGLYSGQQGYDIEYIDGTLTIDKRTLTIDAVGQNRVYDGTRAATVILGDDRVKGDDLTLAYVSAEFDDKNAREGKTVTVSGITVTGADAGNYIWNTTATTTANIEKAELKVTAIGQNRVYDGTKTATVTLSDNRVAGDDLALSYGSAEFADKHAGENKTVSVADIAVTGADASNYIWNTTATTTADIERATLNVTGATAKSRVYDGTTAVAIEGATLTGVFGADDVTLTNADAGSFADKHVGKGKAVSTAMGLSGADADNYVLIQPVGLSADITPRELLISATAQNRVYDGTTAATVTLNDNRVAGDDLNVDYGSAQFADAAPGKGKQIEVLDIAVTGTDAGNYTWNTVAYATADIFDVDIPDPGNPEPDPGPIPDPEPDPSVNPSPQPVSSMPVALEQVLPEVMTHEVRFERPAAVSSFRIEGDIRLPDGLEDDE